MNTRALQPGDEVRVIDATAFQVGNCAKVVDWPDETQLTPAERTAINLTAQLWNTASQLPDQHPSDVAELQADIHAIQNRIMARLARRRHPEIFR